MSFLRDIVAAECAEPNALGRMVNNFEKLGGLQQDQWVQRDELAHEDFQSRLRQEEHELNEEEYERHADDMFKSFDRGATSTRPVRFDPREYEEYLNENKQDMPPPPPHEGDQLLSSIFKSFLMGNHDMRGRFEDFPDLGLSKRDKEKIRDRAGILSRHVHSDQAQEFVDEKLDTLMNALHITKQQERRYEDAWRNTRNNTTTTTSTGRQWEDEYSTFNNRDNQINDEMEDYEEIIRNTADNKMWMEEHFHRASPNRWANEYRRGEGPQSWVDEYSSKSHRQIEEEAMEGAWNDAHHDRLMEAAWGAGEREVARDRINGRSLTDLTDAITRIDDPKLQGSNFMQFMHRINKGQVTFGDNRVIDTPSSPSMRVDNDGLVNNDWLQEYDEFDQEDYPDPREWAKEYEFFNDTISPEKLAEYEFVVNNAANPYSTHEDPFTAGVELFDKGMITEAILALEMEVQRNPMNSKAWHALGQAHAENDKDNLAILSLERAVKVDPQNLDALAALAVSYTNDFSRDKALDTLETWLRSTEEYNHIPPEHQSSHGPHMDGVPDFYTEAWSRHTRVVNMFIEAAQLRPHNPDPEVQTALGLLYNLSYEYDKAVDCFKAALTKRPSDYRLWNKLGATLANSNRGEEALGAYFKALEGKPTYVRAMANLGISFLALNSYNEAAQSFLSALRLHPNAGHLWDNLKMVFRLMSRDDLEERAAKNDIEAFPENFTF